jgi:hypothetical protein
MMWFDLVRDEIRTEPFTERVIDSATKAFNAS